jgi:four helix bundle protein
MTYERFEDLPVWKAAVELAEKIYAFTDIKEFKGKYSLRDQIERAAISVSNNIAEGFERGTTPELLTFLYISRGSAGEVRSMLCVLERLPAFRDLKLHAEGVSKQLRAWADSLQNSPIKGQRYLTDRERKDFQSRKEQAEFMDTLKTCIKKDRPGEEI